jgi:hypothetical protein
VLRHRVGSREDRFFATVFYGSAIIYVVFWVAALAALAALAAIPAAIELFSTPLYESIQAHSVRRAGSRLRCCSSPDREFKRCSS